MIFAANGSTFHFLDQNLVDRVEEESPSKFRRIRVSTSRSGLLENEEEIWIEGESRGVVEMEIWIEEES